MMLSRAGRAALGAVGARSAHARLLLRLNRGVSTSPVLGLNKDVDSPWDWFTYK